MDPIRLAKFVATIVVDLLTGALTQKNAAERLVDAAVATGLPENELASYLRRSSVQRQELLFQAAKAAKVAGKR